MKFCPVFCWSFCKHTCAFSKGTFPFWKVNVCLCERQMCVYKENIINWRCFVYERKMCVYERNISHLKDKCVFVWKTNVCLQREHYLLKMFCLWKENVCFERNICLFEREMSLLKEKLCLLYSFLGWSAPEPNYQMKRNIR